MLPAPATSELALAIEPLNARHTLKEPLLVALTAAPFVAATLVAYVVFSRQIPQPSSFTQNRPEAFTAWTDAYPQEVSSVVAAVLEAVCDAFLIERTHKWRLLPTDSLGAIYRTHYPPQLGLADSLEYEFLLNELADSFSVPEPELEKLWETDATLDLLVRTCAKHARSPAA